MNTKSFYFILIISLFNISLSYSDNLVFRGLNKLNINDLQSLTNINLDNENISNSEINMILKDFYSSDLIFNVTYDLVENIKTFTIEEAKIIENIFFNGNKVFKNQDLLSLININNGNLVNRDDISSSTNFLKNIYASRGFDNMVVNVSLEKYSFDRVNLIYYIVEGTRSQISQIKFIGNSFFSNRKLRNKIKSKSLNFYNFFSKGSNLNKELLDFDKNTLSQLYKDNSFFDVDLSHELKKLSSNNYALIFYIEEGDRYLIDDVIIDLPSFHNLKDFDSLKYKFIDEFNNDSFYNFEKTAEFTKNLTSLLISKNIFNIEISSRLVEKNNKLYLNFTEQLINPKIVNKINISGNTITKDNVIRSKIDIEPGDYLNSKTIPDLKKKINNLIYVNNVNVSEELDDKDKSNITINIVENKKTGNILAAASASGDTGLGLSLGIDDANFIGSGNKLASSFNINSEQAKFTIDYTQYILSNSNITNKYTIFNQDNDFSDSYGFKSSDIGLGYSLGFKYNDVLSVSSGITISNVEGKESTNSSTQVTDNIGEFDQYIFKFNIKYNSTNDFLYPTKGAFNSVSLDYSPDNISDYSYFKLK